MPFASAPEHSTRHQLVHTHPHEFLFTLAHSRDTAQAHTFTAA
eukprot:CAMPEP_0185849262 /NCGR_PEP_ID=MMETSP1354-20130828/3817_1 /TAXON_ID=708628 /ORGANISM="Erythrolobus madagascarensis, Strain CCMP3276" /LENGTH=42 /DNA_ID= /DNA_START= /DNA_END= /DNA_ORIENTATION=